jgi:hypothetical protein
MQGAPQRGFAPLHPPPGGSSLLDLISFSAEGRGGTSAPPPFGTENR